MPPVERIGLTNEFVVFRRKGTDRNGNPTFFPPETVFGRLEHRQYNSFTSLTETVTYDAILYLNQAVPCGSLVVPGPLDSVVGTGTGNPELTEPFEVSVNLDIPDIKGVSTFFRRGLTRFRQSYTVEYGS